MSITVEKPMDLLNMDLEVEYSGAIQYINHAAVIKGAVYAACKNSGCH